MTFTPPGSSRPFHDQDHLQQILDILKQSYLPHLTETMRTALVIRRSCAGSAVPVVSARPWCVKPCTPDQLDWAGRSVDAVDCCFESSAEEATGDDGESHGQFQQIGVVQQG